MGIKRLKEISKGYMEIRDGLEPPASPFKMNPVLGSPFWPHEILRDIAVFFILLSVLLFLNAYGPPPLHDPADPFNTPVPPPSPDWYLYWAWGFLKITPDVKLFDVTIMTGKVLGVLLSGVPFMVLAILPFIDKGKAKRPVEAPVQTAFGVVGIAFIFFISLFAAKHLVTHAFSKDYPWVTEDLLFYLVFLMPTVMGLATYLGLKYKKKKRSYPNLLNKCYQCGKCDDACILNHLYKMPKYNMVQSNYVLEGFSRPDLCYTCGLCESVCPTNMKIIDIVRKQRAVSDPKAKARAQPIPAHKGMFNTIASMEAKAKVPRPLPKKKHMYGYFAGCAKRLPLMNINVDHKGIPKASMALMREAGLDVVELPMGCCGHDQLWQGKTKLFDQLKAMNTEYLKNAGISVLVCSCAECHMTLSKYYDLSKIKVKHISEVLEDKELDLLEAPRTQEGERPKVIYHDPCRLGRQMGVYNAPRNLIQSVPGIKVIEFDDNRERSLCCGISAMSNCNKYTRYYRQVRIDEAVEKGADHFVTTCPKCLAHYGCYRDEDPNTNKLEVVDLTVFIGRFLPGANTKLENKDTSKEDDDTEVKDDVPKG